MRLGYLDNLQDPLDLDTWNVQLGVYRYIKFFNKLFKKFGFKIKKLNMDDFKFDFEYNYNKNDLIRLLADKYCHMIELEYTHGSFDKLRYNEVFQKFYDILCANIDEVPMYRYKNDLLETIEKFKVKVENSTKVIDSIYKINEDITALDISDDHLVKWIFSEFKLTGFIENEVATFIKSGTINDFKCEFVCGEFGTYLMFDIVDDYDFKHWVDSLIGKELTIYL